MVKILSIFVAFLENMNFNRQFIKKHYGSKLHFLSWIGINKSMNGTILILLWAFFGNLKNALKKIVTETVVQGKVILSMVDGISSGLSI